MVTSVWSDTSSSTIRPGSAAGGASTAMGAGRAARWLSLRHSQKARPAAGRKIVCGIAGITPNPVRITATGNHVPGLASWPPICPVRSRLSDTRVTITAAAMDSSSEGTCATSASPTASVTYFSAASPALRPWLIMPRQKPAMMFTARISSAAMASPFTNLLAPSIEP